MFITGRCADAEPPHVDAGVAADEACTLVVYMGLRQLPGIVTRLMDAGRPPDTPAAVIENGSMAAQRRCLARLDELPARVLKAGIQSPALVVVGRVVDLAPELEWFRPAEEPAAPVPAGLPGRVARA